MRDTRVFGQELILPQINLTTAGKSLRDAGVAGALVFVVSFTMLAAMDTFGRVVIWPTEALLLGLMLRMPRLVTPAWWAGAFVGYVLAAMLRGGDLATSLWFAAGNLLSVAVGLVLFRQLPEADRRLRRPASMLALFGIVLTAGGVNALLGAAIAHILLTSTAEWTTFGGWLGNEIANYLIVLPLVLTFPAPAKWPALRLRAPDLADFSAAVPLLALVVSAIAGLIVGGPGAIAFPIPALLWCALTYGLFPTVALTTAFSVWKTIAYSTGIVAFDLGLDSESTFMSMRLGIVLITLGPLTVATINASRADLMQTLDRSANYDYLTGALTRSAFMERGQRLCEVFSPTSGVSSVLAMDIDQFKKINDTFGHAAGDRVLVAFVEAVDSVLRPGDLFGRLGGEEFAVLAPLARADEAYQLAEQIRERVEQAWVPLDDGQSVRVTVSIGYVTLRWRSQQTVDAALASADQALYAAKAAGRNRVMPAEPL
ncbi:MAG: diguanylate cyclase [Thermomicrobiales bacterium]